MPRIFQDHVLGKSIFTVDVRYQGLRPIGRGAYGLVAAADDVVLGRKVAIKRVANLFQDLIDAKRILREIKMLRHFEHDNLVKLLDLMTPPREGDNFHTLYIVTDLFECDLERIISSNQALTEQHAQFFMYQLLRGMKYLHSAAALHRDLKPSNVLVNSNCDLAICDFGLARGVDQLTMLTHAVVTRWYRAPELLCEEKDYGPPLDIWSLGCIFAEIMGRKPLFPGHSNREQLELIITKLGMPSPEDMRYIKSAAVHKYIEMLPKSPPMDWEVAFPTASHDAHALLARMLTFDPAARITVDEALRHPFCTKLHDPEREPTCPTLFDWSFERGYEGTKEMPIGLLRGFIKEEMAALAAMQEAAASASSASHLTPAAMLTDDDAAAAAVAGKVIA